MRPRDTRESGQTFRGLAVLARLLLFVALVFAALSGAVYGGARLYRNLAMRTITVCAATDVSFRLQRPDWEHRLMLWMAEVNRVESAT